MSPYPNHPTTSISMKLKLIATSFLLSITTAIYAEIPVGILLGFEGPIESLTPAMADAAELAFNEASTSGLLPNGESIKPIRANSSCINPTTAINSAKELVEENKVVAIVGADCSGVTKAVINAVTTPKRIPMISPSATSPSLTQIKDDGYFYRTAPSDATAAKILAEIAKEKGIKQLTISYVDNDYGKGYAYFFKQAAQKQGITVLGSYPHKDLDKKNTSMSDYDSYYAEQAKLLTKSGGDALFLAGYIDTGGYKIMQNTVSTNKFDHYLLPDGMIGDSLMKDLNPQGKLDDKVIGLAPGIQQADYPMITELKTGKPFIQESYDAAALIALAIKAGNSSKPEDINKHILEITNEPGEKIYSGEIKKGLELLQSGKKINYQGASRVIFDQDGNASGSYKQYAVQGDQFIAIKQR